MKKLLIVNNNLNIGGVQKSLYNLLWSLPGDVAVTLYLFQNTGEYAHKLPPGVKVLEDHSLFSLLGLSQGACRGLKQHLTRGILAALTKVFGRHAVMRLLLWSKKTLPEEYDCAIAFLHNGNPKNFYGGVQDFVLHRTRAKKKIAFLHCDYATCGANHKQNNRLLQKFDAIAACSEGCKKALLSVLPQLEDRCTVVHNCHRYEEIRALATENPFVYEPNYFHILMVCRLAHEKGVDRVLRALAKLRSFPVKLHLVGDGAKRQELQNLCADLQLSETVIFHGEQANPYRYMPNAHLFLLSSYHEAAPLVIEEAACLGLPVLTVKTTSAEEMVAAKGIGWVCDNRDAALEEQLRSLLEQRERLPKITEYMPHNRAALAEFRNII